MNEVAEFVRREMGGAFTWDEVARYRERWKRPLVVKGVLHPADAEKAVSLGVDGIVVSNHGGRQVEALPAAIDVLPAIAAAAGGRAAVMMDCGVRSGQTWCARSRSAPTPPLPARLSCGGSARWARRDPATSSIS